MKRSSANVLRRATGLLAIGILLLGSGCRSREGTVYYVAGDNLFSMDLTGRVASVHCTGLPKTEGLVMDSANQRLLMSTWGSGSPILVAATVQGDPAVVRYQGPGDCGQGLAYDAAESNLFCGLYYGGVYARNESGTQGWRQLVAASALDPMIGQRGQLVLDTARRQVYFRSAFNGDCDRCRWIWRVNYDGSGLTQVLRANGGDALTLDPSKGHLYYSDGPGDGVIKRANLDGTGEKTILNLKAPYNYCIHMVADVPGRKLYMYLAQPESNWRNRAIARCALNGSGFEILTELGGVGEGAGGIAFVPR